MNRYTCKIITEKVRDTDGVPHTVYGLEFSGNFSAVYRDLCTDKRKLSVLAKLLNRHRPEPISVPDLIEDFLFTE